jgi:hypothetical protein
VVSVTRSVMGAPGGLAPGHLGELTRIVLFELVDAVLEETCARERRLLPLLDGSMLVLMDRGFDAGDFLALLGSAVPQAEWPGAVRAATVPG